MSGQHIKPAEVEGLAELRKASDAATGDPARYPRRGVIDRYQSAVVAAYESGDLVSATALTALQAENERLRASRRVMHRRAQKAEGRAERLLWWLGGIKRLADLSKHWRMGSFADAAMRGSKPDTGTAWMLGHLTCRREAEAAVARAEKAEAERDAWKTNAEGLAVALKVTRDDLLSALHSEFDGVWTEADFEEETASADDALAAHAKLKGEV